MIEKIDIMDNDITLEGIFCTMLNNKTNELIFNFEYEGIALSLKWKLETRKGE